MLGSVIDAVLLNGTVGAGKSTTAAALSDLLSRDGQVHALIDTDWIRMLRPAPVGDPFQHGIATANLRSMVRNFRAAGAARAVVAGVVETAEQHADVLAALVPLRVLTCRLVASPEVLADRLRTRHADVEEREWHLERAPRLAAILDGAAMDELVLDTAEAGPRDTALRIARAAGWSP